jgi:excisionase family DNA binding protein
MFLGVHANIKEPFMSATPEDAIEPLVVRPKQAMKMLNCERAQLYEMIAAGELDSYRDGAARKITIASIHQRINRKIAEAKRTAA